jgi:hypothetical protein
MKINTYRNMSLMVCQLSKYVFFEDRIRLNIGKVALNDVPSPV